MANIDGSDILRAPYIDSNDVPRAWRTWTAAPIGARSGLERVAAVGKQDPNLPPALTGIESSTS